MRGKGHRKTGRVSVSRITPAYAGKSFFFRTSLVQWQDHPRLCGEKNPKNPAKNSRKGSPPPMRGKVEGAKCVKIDHGITPAYAGKSVFGGDILCMLTGSPPPMRGKACGLCVAPRRSRDHPRLCGEKSNFPFCFFWYGGSPPPMRGKD